MTEDEHIRLCEAGDEFCKQLATATAQVVAQFSPEMLEDVVYYLQDHTSLFSPFTYDRMVEEVRRLRDASSK
jgi:hypothetical protein